MLLNKLNENGEEMTMKSMKDKVNRKNVQFHKIKRIGALLCAMVFLAGLTVCDIIGVGMVAKVSAATASAITFGTVDYENLTLQVYNNNNSTVYYSTDNTNWEEMDAAYSSSTSSYSMDISWTPATSDTTLYFKGDSVKTVKQITLPAQNTDFAAEYDKVQNEFTFSSMDDADYFEWRNTTDYYWNKVSFNENSASYQNFMDTIEGFRLKGAKIIIRIPQTMGTGAGNVGARPSKEINITIPSQPAAPAVKVNSSKLTLSTTTSLEYYDTQSELWMECESSMPISSIAPSVLYENGASAVTLQIRKAATGSTPSSKILKLKLPAQTAAPTIGDRSADITYYYLNGKLVIQFNNASDTNLYEYAVIKANYTFTVASASWKTVKTTQLMTFSTSTAPEGCTIYVRKKGRDENTNSNLSLILASDVNSFTVNY
jgi:hypothetical protein